MRRGNLELIDFFNYEIASLRSQRRLKYFFNSLLWLAIAYAAALCASTRSFTRSFV